MLAVSQKKVGALPSYTLEEAPLVKPTAISLDAYSPRVATILRIVMEQSHQIDAIRTGHIAFHFTEGSEIKPKFKNELPLGENSHVVFDGNLAIRTT